MMDAGCEEGKKGRKLNERWMYVWMDTDKEGNKVVREGTLKAAKKKGKIL